MLSSDAPPGSSDIPLNLLSLIQSSHILRQSMRWLDFSYSTFPQEIARKPAAYDIDSVLNTLQRITSVRPSASRSAIQSDALSLGLNHPNPVNLLSSDAPPGSGLTPMNPTIAHTKKPHLASIVTLSGFVIFDFPARNYKKTLYI
jgi:hypothetical protein